MTAAGLLADPVTVRKLLIESAAARRSITYSELLNALGHAFSRPKMRALCKVLTHIDRLAAERGEPELAVLVVRQSDGLPGQGWWCDTDMIHGYDGRWTGPEAAEFVSRLQGRAFDFWASEPASIEAG